MYIYDLELEKWIFKKDKMFYFSGEHKEGFYFYENDNNKTFENEIFMNDGYFKILKAFDDISIIAIDRIIYMLLFYKNKKEIKALKINSHFECGDISVFKIKPNDFHFTIGHSIISNKKIKIIKPFDLDIEDYNFVNFTKKERGLI